MTIKSISIQVHSLCITLYSTPMNEWSTTYLHVPGLLVGLPQGGLNLLPKKTFFGCESTFAAKNGFNLLPVGRRVKKDRISLKAETERNKISLSNHCQDFALDIGAFKKQKNDLCIIRSASLNDFSGDRHLFVWQPTYSNLIAKSENTFP